MNTSNNNETIYEKTLQVDDCAVKVQYGVANIDEQTNKEYFIKTFTKNTVKKDNAFKFIFERKPLSYLRLSDFLAICQKIYLKLVNYIKQRYLN